MVYILYHIGFVGDFSSMWYDNPFSTLNATDVRVQGNIAYVAGGSDGLYTLDVSNPNNPILLDQIVEGVDPYYRKLDVRGNYAYVADYGLPSGGLRIYDVSDPTNIQLTDNILLTYATDVVVSGDMAYVADGSYGIYIFNITDPYNIPGVYSYFDIFTNVTALWVQGPNLYVVENIAGGPITTCLYVYDISDIANEILVGSESVDAQFYDIFVDGDIAYTSDKDWMIVYDVSDPTNPVFPPFAWTNGESYGAWGFGPYCISADSFEGVSLVNNTDVNFAPIISTYSDATSALQVSTHGDYTYVANKTSLVILRHFESAGATFIPGTQIAQSTEIDSTDLMIYNATLDSVDFIPDGSNINYLMSADAGTHWEAVIPGVKHIFANPGNDLRWRAVIAGPSDRSSHIYEIEIDYDYNEPPSEPTLSDPGDVSEVSSVMINWTASTDDGTIDHYELQVDNETSFATPFDSWNTSELSQVVSGLTSGTYYFRVRAVDNYGLPGSWSDIVDLDIDISAINIPWWAYVIIGGGLVLIAVIIVVFVMVRKRKVPTR
ncbi:MAG: fibronectin type III domain-containing protein [Candidatus Heimdallarchaeota archaeon]